MLQSLDNLLLVTDTPRTSEFDELVCQQTGKVLRGSPQSRFRQPLFKRRGSSVREGPVSMCPTYPYQISSGG